MINPVSETVVGLKGAWTDAKKSFAPVVESAKKNLKEVVPSIKNASKKVLADARNSAVDTFNRMTLEDNKGLKLLGQSAGLLAVNYGLSAFTNIIHPVTPEAQAAASAVYTVFGLINGGVGTFTADKAIKFYNHMKSLKSK